MAIAEAKSAIGELRLTARNREWIRLHVLEGLKLAEIGERDGRSTTTVCRAINSAAGQRYADELLAEHARRLRGRVAKMADAAADVIEQNLAAGSAVADYVRSADARFVLEKTAFPLDITPIAEAIKDPLSELCAWLAKGVAPAPADPLSSTGSQPSPPPPGVNGQARTTNGIGYGSSRG